MALGWSERRARPEATSVRAAQQRRQQATRRARLSTVTQSYNERVAHEWRSSRVERETRGTLAALRRSSGEGRPGAMRWKNDTLRIKIRPRQPAGTTTETTPLALPPSLARSLPRRRIHPTHLERARPRDARAAREGGGCGALGCNDKEGQGRACDRGTRNERRRALARRRGAGASETHLRPAPQAMMHDM